MNQHTPESDHIDPDGDLLWLCNSTDLERFDTHDWCLVHECEVPTNRPCPETLRRLAMVAPRPRLDSDAIVALAAIVAVVLLASLGAVLAVTA